MTDPTTRKIALTAEALNFMYALPRRFPDKSAVRVLNLFQKCLLLVLGVLLVAGLAWNSTVTLTVVNGFFLSFYLLLVLFKFALIHFSITSRKELHFEEAELNSLSDKDLPLYTILVPLYREAECLPRLLKSIEALDYPREKLEVLWLLEADDQGTIEAATDMELPPHVRLVTVPEGAPKTKPKACNLGLALARGECLVIYDAEDVPEPDQLKKAVLGFQKCDPTVICLQAKLNFYNQRQNLLTKWFTADYSTWFDLVLPGLDYLETPIPLGGTSNHFRTRELRELLGWDPYNVTEDCDLGVRLAAAGYRTRILQSTTWEEACSVLRYWIRQRSRWVKGYIQTYLVHQRKPFGLSRKLGIAGALSFHLMVGGTVLSLLVNPVYWSLTLLWFVFRWEMFSQLFPFPLIMWGLICLFVGNFVFVYSSVLAIYQRGNHDLVKHCLLMPLYWVLMSIGAWKGLLQLLQRPSFWEKTTHGLDLTAAE